MKGDENEERERVEDESETHLKIVVKIEWEAGDNDIVAGYACGKRNQDSCLI